MLPKEATLHYMIKKGGSILNEAINDGTDARP
jgi:hypothetical protein